MLELLLVNLVVMLVKAALEGLAIGAGIGLMLRKAKR